MPVHKVSCRVGSDHLGQSDLKCFWGSSMAAFLLTSDRANEIAFKFGL